MLDHLLKVLSYICPSIRDEVLLCKIIYEIIIETKENLTQIKMSHNRVISVLLLTKMNYSA